MTDELWTPEAKRGLTYWSRYSLDGWGKSKCIDPKNGYFDDAKTFDFVREAFVSDMPYGLKPVLLLRDDEFEQWYSQHESAARQLLSLFTLAGEAPMFGFSYANGHPQFPTSGSVGNHWTSFTDTIKQIQFSLDALAATKALRADYRERIKRDFGGVLSQ